MQTKNNHFTGIMYFFSRCIGVTNYIDVCITLFTDHIYSLPNDKNVTRVIILAEKEKPLNIYSFMLPCALFYGLLSDHVDDAFS
jgi:hypothetical protein